MKILFSILMLFFALLGISQDENPFGDVSFFDDLDKPPQDHKKFVLNVEKSIFGVAPYSTEKQIIKKLGNPLHFSHFQNLLWRVH